MSQINDVYAFNIAVGNIVQGGEPDLKMLRQAVNHCQEELGEILQAYHGDDSDDWPESSNFAGLYEELKAGELSIPTFVERVEQLADGALDLMYVATNILYSLGIKDPARLWNRVHAANMAKIVGGKVLKDANGKTMKPEGWKPPNLFDPLLEEFR